MYMMSEGASLKDAVAFLYGASLGQEAGFQGRDWRNNEEQEESAASGATFSREEGGIVCERERWVAECRR